MAMVVAGCGAGVRVEPVPAACRSPHGPAHAYAQWDELQTLLQGQWLYCSGPELVATSSVGIEFVTDSTYYVLVLDASGRHVARSTNPEDDGSWSNIAGTLVVAWKAFAAVDDVHTGVASFEDNPRRLLMDMDSIGTGEYVIAP
jgi:hypothetical protein